MSYRWKSNAICHVVPFCLLLGCGDSPEVVSDASSIDALTEADATAPGTQIEISLQRVGDVAPYPFEVTVIVTDNSEPLSGATINVVLSRGTSGDVLDNQDGSYTFLVTPDQTGEYKVTVSYDGVSVSRTAVVMASVHADWGQAMAVEGLVNTEGYEDGVTITPDGEYLFVQYGPVYFSGIFLFQASRANGGCEGHRLEFPTGIPNLCAHPWIDDVKGPISGPARPGFFDGRISADGSTWLHNANSWSIGPNVAPNFAVSTMFYGFKRQPDGSFSEPFTIAFEDENDGLIGPFGLSFLPEKDGVTRMAFAFNDPADADMVDFDGNGTDDAQSLFDIFTTTMTMGENTTLGTYVPAGGIGVPPVRGTPFESTLVNFGKVGIEGIAGTQGNPHLHAPGGGDVLAVFTDDEFDEGGDHGDIAVHVLESGVFPNGVWSKTVLPSAINKTEPSSEIQPFFGQDGLYFTRLGDGVIPAIRYAAYMGGEQAVDFADNGKWSEAVDILTAGEFVLGGVAGIGEPTVTIRNGKEVLYFVYAIIRGFDVMSGLPDLDLQAGYIQKGI